MHRFLCLDLGNVLFHVDLEEFKDALSHFCQSPDNFIHDTECLVDCGLLNIESAIRLYGSIQKHDDAGALVNAWHKVIKPDVEMVEWVEKLIDKGVQVAILSNIGVDHAAAILKNPFIKNIYNRRWFSCEVGVRKPSRLYFQTFLDAHPAFKGSHYLDDRDENLNMGATYGLKTIKFRLNEWKSLSSDKRQEKLIEITTRITGQYKPLY